MCIGEYKVLPLGPLIITKIFEKNDINVDFYDFQLEKNILKNNNLLEKLLEIKTKDNQIYISCMINTLMFHYCKT